MPAPPARGRIAAAARGAIVSVAPEGSATSYPVVPGAGRMLVVTTAGTAVGVAASAPNSATFGGAATGIRPPPPAAAAVRCATGSPPPRSSGVVSYARQLAGSTAAGTGVQPPPV